MEAFGLILMVIGAIGCLATGIILLIAAFQEGVGWGIASFFCGFVLLYFCFMNFNQVYKPFLANIGFAIMYGIGIGLQN
tara:strand:- start:300 stop:536 length:237 start_codon:yes stop_codon:yes gene_type:complete